mmetsp:Transcript_12040/g.38133  ORF Transcript_12040/g.38133 Transcript_12040/m.38133 type:complete len:220 (+) Transcript_12040:1797-2456(+)
MPNHQHRERHLPGPPFLLRGPQGDVEHSQLQGTLWGHLRVGVRARVHDRLGRAVQRQTHRGGGELAMVHVGADPLLLLAPDGQPPLQLPAAPAAGGQVRLAAPHHPLVHRRPRRELSLGSGGGPVQGDGGGLGGAARPLWGVRGGFVPVPQVPALPTLPRLRGGGVRHLLPVRSRGPRVTREPPPSIWDNAPRSRGCGRLEGHMRATSGGSLTPPSQVP